MKLLIIVMPVVLTACMTRMTKPGASIQEIQRDRVSCMVSAEQAGFSRSDGRIPASIQRNRFISDCLEGLGWTRPMD